MPVEIQQFSEVIKFHLFLSIGNNQIILQAKTVQYDIHKIVLQNKE